MSDAKLISVGLPFPFAGGNLASGSFTFDAANDAVEIVTQLREAGTYTRVALRFTAVVGTCPTFKVSVQGVDASGNPDGVIAASKVFNPTSLGWAANSVNWLDFDASFVGTRGQKIAIVVAYESGTVDVSNGATFATSLSTSLLAQFPYTILNNAGTRARQTTTPLYGIGTAAKAYGLPFKGSSTPSVNTGSTPDETAMAFALPAGWGSTFQLAGVRYFGDCPAGQNFTVNLYNGTTLLQDVTQDGDLTTSATAERCVEIYFDEAALATLNYGDTYRVSILPGGTSNQQMTVFEVAAAADWEAFQGGQLFWYSTRTDAGAWTDDLTKRPAMELILADITEPSGSGGGLLLPRAMNGGYSG